ncbi:MAG: hypothetical protein WCX07_05245 [Dehalococcoidales bacterium]|jgi:hypothetical protein|nr:hypothetical protein [Dehalococcoidales bacterium]NLT28378.1 hypothetical protein [Dehalococcoidales bacterium]
MSCYFRHMQSIPEEAGITVTQDNKKEIDRKIHEIVDVSYKNCPEAWRAIKAGTADAEQRSAFVAKLKEALGNVLLFINYFARSKQLWIRIH